MSGKLVGEVLAASEELRARGLSPRGFHALVAIAEKSQTDSRQGSVRWDHIRSGIYGASLSTAKRAVADLKSAGVIRIIKRGFNNQNGRVCAPIYEIGSLVSKHSECVTQVTHSLMFEEQGKHAQAKQSFLDAIKLFTRVYGETHPKTQELRERLYKAIGRADSSPPFTESAISGEDDSSEDTPSSDDDYATFSPAAASSSSSSAASPFDQERAQVLFERGKSKFSSGDRAGAKQDLQQALRLCDSQSALYRQIDRALVKSGKRRAIG